MLPLHLERLSFHKGKIIGAIAGALLYGFWGCVVGLIAGIAYDQWKDFMVQLKKLNIRTPQMPFLSSRTALVLSVVAYARALDLPALDNSRHALDILKKHFEIDYDTLRYVGKILNTEAPQSSDMPAQLHQLKEACRLQSGLRPSIILCLLELAANSKGSVDTVSARAIREAGHILGMTEDEWRGLIAHVTLEKQDDDPYTVIGVSRHAGADAVQQAYRDLMRTSHPDAAMHENNVYARARLTERAARINAAYEKLKKSRA
jgi:DnaJ-domain-containing protein 1